VQVPERKPWQMTEAPSFSGGGDVNVHTFDQIKDERGLAAFSLSLKPHATAAAPDPSQSGGQYIIVTRGQPHVSGQGIQGDLDRVREARRGGNGSSSQEPKGSRRWCSITRAASLPSPKRRRRRHRRSTAYGNARCARSCTKSRRACPTKGIACRDALGRRARHLSCPDCAASKSDFSNEQSWAEPIEGCIRAAACGPFFSRRYEHAQRWLPAVLACATAVMGSRRPCSWRRKLRRRLRDRHIRPKIIRVINPNQPGGNSDILFRLLAPRMGEILGQQLVIDYRPGAGGNIGAEPRRAARPTATPR
jgi:hypothetical protein